MNTDPFEERLRSLRPGVLPEDLRRRLEDPPEPGTPRRSNIIRMVFAATAAAAACAVFLLRPDPAPPSAAAPVMATTRSSRVTEVKPLTVMTDASSHPWKLLQVNWVEEDTLVSAAKPSAYQVQDYYETVVPVPVIFD